MPKDAASGRWVAGLARVTTRGGGAWRTASDHAPAGPVESLGSRALVHFVPDFPGAVEMFAHDRKRLRRPRIHAVRCGNDALFRLHLALLRAERLFVDTGLHVVEHVP